jgi:hypothetical protein
MGIDRSSFSYKSIKYDRYINSNLNSNLSWFVGEDNVIGIDVENMMDNETKNEFRHRVFLELKKFGFTGNEDEVNWRLPEFEVSIDEQY